jgi:hypothetical protein
MQFISLHPFDTRIAEAYVGALLGTREPDPRWATWWSDDLRTAMDVLRNGSEAAANRLTVGLALAMATEHPVFMQEGFGFTAWEAQVDRGVGMLIRPPARVFVDAGVDRRRVEEMPIRLDLQGGMMGGAYVPERLIGQLDAMLDERLERIAKRLKEADYDPIPMLGLMHAAVTYAKERNLGLYEAIDVVTPDMTFIRAPEKKQMDPAFRERIERAIAEEKKPGIIGRLFGRKKPNSEPT